MRKIPFPKKILIINIFGIGDVLFTTPLIKNLKAHDAGVSIGYLCNGRTAGILESDPDIDNVFVYERDDFQAVKESSWMAYISKMSGLIQSIKREHFDAAIDVSMSDFTSWAAWMAGIKDRIGFRYKARGKFLNRPLAFNGYEARHVVDYYFDLLKVLDIDHQAKEMSIPIRDEDSTWAKAYYEENIGRMKEKKAVGIVAGGGASWGKEAFYKRWAPENYAKLADKLIEKFNVPIILMGDKNEIGICREVSDRMVHQPIMACGKTTIGQFAALARHCALMIVNDGGPLHISVAAGARTASIFGPVDETVYGPYPSGNHIVITKDLACRPCYRKFRRADCSHISCLQQLTVEEVFDQVKVAL